MEIAENSVLAIALLWAIWQTLSLRNMALNGGTIIPPAITHLIFFIVSLAVVVACHFSPFHLIWLFLLSLVLGFVAIIFPLGQKMAIAFLGILSMTGNSSEETES